MMKNILSVIRWKFVLPTALVVAGIVLFFVVFFDPLLARVIEAAGSRVNGAKVEVAGLQTKIFQGRLFIARLQVTDKNNTWINLVESGPLVFHLSFYDLLSRRLIIPEAGLNGVRFNTDRATDGRIRRKPKKRKDEKPGVAERLAAEASERFVVTIGEAQTDAKAKIEFDPKSLRLTQQTDELKAKADSLPGDWKNRVDALNVEARLENIKKLAKEVEETPTQGAAALKAIPESLKKINQAKSETKALKSDVKSTREGMDQELKSLRAGVADLENARKRDYEDLLARFNLDFADPKRLIEGVVGPALMGNLSNALRVMEIARRAMPSKKEQEERRTRPRAGGTDIPFPTPAAPPRFWLKNASLSGQYEAIDLSGGMAHATSDPPRVGIPFTIDLKGSKGANRYRLEFEADHTTDVARDRFLIEGQNLGAEKLITSGPLGKALSGGRGDIRFALSWGGDDHLDGNLRIDLKELKLIEAALLEELGGGTLQTHFARSLAKGMETIPSVQVTALLRGSWSSPRVDIKTNLDDLFKKVIRDTLGEALQEQKKDLENQLNALLTSRKGEIEAKAAALAPQMGTLLGGVEKSLEDQLSRLTKAEGILGSSSRPDKIPSLDKLFKR